tara:strand:- start:1297 stop:1416 length:120 start_codon:yes stop_codon:yes gene_type:complete
LVLLKEGAMGEPWVPPKGYSEEDNPVVRRDRGRRFFGNY